jgi:hypothetical protein
LLHMYSMLWYYNGVFNYQGCKCQKYNIMVYHCIISLKWHPPETKTRAQTTVWSSALCLSRSTI